MKDPCESCCSRREFLHIASAIVASGPLVSFLSSCGSSGDNGDAAPAAVDVPNSASNNYTFSFTQFPDLQNTGGSVHVKVAATSGSKDLFVTRISSTSVNAVSAICTHQSCTLNKFMTSSQQYGCPCHSSRFNADGSVAQGPATTALSSYTGTVTATGADFTIA